MVNLEGADTAKAAFKYEVINKKETKEINMMKSVNTQKI